MVAEVVLLAGNHVEQMQTAVLAYIALDLVNAPISAPMTNITNAVGHSGVLKQQPLTVHQAMVVAKQFQEHAGSLKQTVNHLQRQEHAIPTIPVQI